jgi:hypothetical protein
MHFYRLFTVILTILKILGALGRLMASLPDQALSFRACDQASLHAAFCAALQARLRTAAPRTHHVLTLFAERHQFSSC